VERGWLNKELSEGEPHCFDVLLAIGGRKLWEQPGNPGLAVNCKGAPVVIRTVGGCS